MKKVVCVWLFLLLVFSTVAIAIPQGGLDQRVTELSQQISKEMTENQKRTIAVIEFADLKGCVSDFGRYLAEELITRLYQTKKFKVIERQLLNKVIAEQKLSLTGMIDPASAKQLGRLLGVDAIVSGTVTELAQSLKVNARLFSTETAEVFSVASTEIFKDESVMKLSMTSPCSKPILDSTPPPTPTSAPSPNNRLSQKFVANDFTLELSTCRMSGRSVTCRFTLTNDSSEDKEFGFYTRNRSRMFDEIGNEYIASDGQLGSQSGFNPVQLVLVPHIITKGAITFDNVDLAATKVTVLRLLCTHVVRNSWANWNADFKNIPITK